MLEEAKKDISKNVAEVIKRSPHEIVILLEKPKESFGDLALPCFKLKKELFTDPVKIAKDIATNLKKPPCVKKVEVKGPYINFFLDESYLARKTLSKVLQLKDSYGAGPKKKEKLMIEGYGQPNTHKAFHIGHFRNVCISDSLARIERFYGYNVITANYIGDIGMHVAKWLWFYTKFYKGKIPKQNVSKWLNEIYAEASKAYEKHEEYHEEVSNILKELENNRNAKLKKLWAKTRTLSLKNFNEIYKKIGALPDVIFYESKLSKRGKELVKQLVKKGVAKIDQGATIVDLKKYGLDVLVLLKSDNVALYSTRDLALAELKFKRFAIDKSIYIVAAEQGHYLKQLFKTLELLGFRQAKNCYHLPYGLVLLHGKKMASRAGEIVMFENVFEEAKQKAKQEVLKRNEKISQTKAELTAKKIALAALKYAMLKQSPDKVIDFDVEKALAFEGDTGPYLQYSLVRAKKILQKIKAKPSLTNLAFDVLQSDEEMALVKAIANFSETVTKAAQQYAPNIIANYSYELTQKFNAFYEKCPVAKADTKTKAVRVLLVWAFAQTLKNALNLLGIEEVEIM